MTSGWSAWPARRACQVRPAGDPCDPAPSQRRRAGGAGPRRDRPAGRRTVRARIGLLPARFPWASGLSPATSSPTRLLQMHTAPGGRRDSGAIRTAMRPRSKWTCSRKICGCAPVWRPRVCTAGARLPRRAAHRHRRFRARRADPVAAGLAPTVVVTAADPAELTGWCDQFRHGPGAPHRVAGVPLPGAGAGRCLTLDGCCGSTRAVRPCSWPCRRWRSSAPWRPGGRCCRASPTGTTPPRRCSLGVPAGSGVGGVRRMGRPARAPSGLPSGADRPLTRPGSPARPSPARAVTLCAYTVVAAVVAAKTMIHVEAGHPKPIGPLAGALTLLSTPCRLSRRSPGPAPADGSGRRGGHLPVGGRPPGPWTDLLPPPGVEHVGCSPRCAASCSRPRRCGRSDWARCSPATCGADPARLAGPPVVAAGVVTGTTLWIHGQQRAPAGPRAFAYSCRQWPLTVCVHPALHTALPSLEAALTPLAARPERHPGPLHPGRAPPRQRLPPSRPRRRLHPPQRPVPGVRAPRGAGDRDQPARRADLRRSPARPRRAL